MSNQSSEKVKGFFSNNIKGLTAIVGKNGSGKTNLSEFLNYNLAHARNGSLATYMKGEGTKGKGENDDDEEFPVKEFEELLELLEQAIVETKIYCKELGADIDAILNLGEKGFKEVELFQEYANLILEKDEYRKQLGLFVNTIVGLYDSATPEIYSFPQIKKARDVFEYLRKVVDRHVDQDEAIERAKRNLNNLLDTSVLGKGDLQDQPYEYGSF